MSLEADEAPSHWRIPRRIGVVLFAALVVFLTLNLYVLLALTVGVALSGTLVRHRAHHVPRQQQADVEASSVPGPGSLSFIGVLLRVRNLEGYYGFLKGAVPTAFVTLLPRFLPFFLFWEWRQFYWDAMPPGPHELYDALLRLLISVPLLVIVNREVAGSHAPNWRSPRAAFASLFDESERFRTWNLFRALLPIPVVLAEATRLVILWGVDALVRELETKADQELMTDDAGVARRKFDWSGVTPLVVAWIAAALLIKLLSMVLICPLEVVVVRLSCQRSLSDMEGEGSEHKVEGSTQSNNEAVIRLRMPSYTGAWDCLLSIWREEGWTALYRAFWVTLFFTGNGVTWNAFANTWQH